MIQCSYSYLLFQFDIDNETPFILDNVRMRDSDMRWFAKTGVGEVERNDSLILKRRKGRATIICYTTLEQIDQKYNKPGKNILLISSISKTQLYIASKNSSQLWNVYDHTDSLSGFHMISEKSRTIICDSLDWISTWVLSQLSS